MSFILKNCYYRNEGRGINYYNCTIIGNVIFNEKMIKKPIRFLIKYEGNEKYSYNIDKKCRYAKNFIKTYGNIEGTYESINNASAGRIFIDILNKNKKINDIIKKENKKKRKK